MNISENTSDKVLREHLFKKGYNKIVYNFKNNLKATSNYSNNNTGYFAYNSTIFKAMEKYFEVYSVDKIFEELRKAKEGIGGIIISIIIMEGLSK